MESQILVFFFVAAFIESAINWFKEGYWSPWVIASLVAGLFFAVVLDLDVLAMQGLATSTNYTVEWAMKIAGWLMGGVALGRGANYVHNLLDS